MSGSQFSLTPVHVPKVETRFRRIQTPIPVPESLPILEDLARIESRSMHGQMPVVWDKAEDFLVSDRWGNRWIDFTSTIFVANAGHANREITGRLRAMLDHGLVHSYTYATEIRARYLRKLIDLTPGFVEKAFLLSSGTEATECALKLMRLHGMKVGKRHPGVVSFEGAMHGRTMGAQLLGGSAQSRAWVGHDDPHIHRLAFPYPWGTNGLSGSDRFHADLEALRARGVDPQLDLCGFIMESYVGWAALFFPPDYVQALSGFARQHNILVTFDEIQSGFGRTGKLFAFEHYEVEPDLICCGKGMSSSVPLSGVLGRRDILDLPDIGSMSSTHSANPLACAAGLANLEAIVEHRLVNEARRKGEILLPRLRDLAERSSGRIRYVFGNGLLAALVFVDPRSGAPDADAPTRICEKAMKKGLLLVHTGRESVKIGPPLTISEEALDEGLSVLEECFHEVAD